MEMALKPDPKTGDVTIVEFPRNAVLRALTSVQSELGIFVMQKFSELVVRGGVQVDTSALTPRVESARVSTQLKVL